jgi:hypothetical protein
MSLDSSETRRAVGRVYGILAVLSFTVSPLAAQVSRGGDSPRLMPAMFREYRVFVRPVTQGGDTLTFYTDTGGGTNMLFQPVAEHLSLQLTRVQWGDDSVTVTPWPNWQAEASIPSASDTTGVLAGRLLVVSFGGEPAMLQDSGDAGFLSRTWFGNRVWTFDYPRRQLWLRSPGDVPNHQPLQRVTLGFQVDSSGGRTMNFPRIRVAVDGDSLDLLLDTGATMTLTDSALQVLNDGHAARRAASFISADVFNRWRAKHLDWRVIEHATSFAADLIEVPIVEVAGQRIGPVWFERRRTGVFEDYMSSMMDQPIVGALGGNALRFFRMTIDYPNAVAVFERP